MRPSRSVIHAAVVIAAIAAIAACGGGGGGKAESLTGLGQECAFAMNNAQCPSVASGCLAFSTDAPTGICSNLCVSDGMMTTDAQGQIAMLTPDPRTAEATAMCTTAFSGTVGTPVCTAIVQYTPQDAVLVANTTYTGVNIACTIACAAGGKCPGDLTCNVSANRCEP